MTLLLLETSHWPKAKVQSSLGRKGWTLQYDDFNIFDLVV
jgi:hypothetical protein